MLPGSPGATTMGGVPSSSDPRAPWRSRPGLPPRRLPHLVVAWYWSDPRRIGEAALVAGQAVLGRQGTPGQQLEWVHQRPGRNVPRPPLDDRRISRLQLALEPGQDTVQVINHGRCELLHNGVRTDRATARAGDVLTLRDVAVFLLEWRPEALPPCLHYDSENADFEFGSPDRQGMLGESEAAWQLRDELAGIAAAEGHALIHGPSGSGKEVAAQILHELSARRGQALVSRNAATIPESLIDAELFGNAKNYPNPGTPERLGLIGEADRGTLVLDEIGELPESHQAHLLRVLDRSGEYQRLGESRQRRSDFRMVGVTNRPISSLKDDFLARFALRVEVPDLNRRRSDVTLAVRSVWRELAEADPELARRFASDRRQPEPLIEPRLIELLVRHQYTHNFRQLSQLFQLAVRSSSDCYIGRTAAIDEQVAAPPCEELDRSAIETALQQSNGRPTEAARLLGLRNRFALYRLMQTHGIEKGALRSGG